jgi:hypothetical protein
MNDRRLVRLAAQYLSTRSEAADMGDRAAVLEILSVSSFAWREDAPDAPGDRSRLTDAARVWCRGLRLRVVQDLLVELLEQIVATQATGEAGVRGKLSVWRTLADPEDADRLLDSAMRDFRAQRRSQRRSA